MADNDSWAGALDKRQRRVVGAYMRAACASLGKRYRHDCCIAATRIACDVLGTFGVKIEPLVVIVRAANPIFADWLAAHGRWPESAAESEAIVAQGGHMVAIGETDTAAQPGKWVGHLAGVVENTLLLDVTLGQASRPAKDMLLSAITYPITPAFLTGEPVTFEMNRCMIAYVPRLNVADYEPSPDWNSARHAAAVAEITALMKRDGVERSRP